MKIVQLRFTSVLCLCLAGAFGEISPTLRQNHKLMSFILTHLFPTVCQRCIILSTVQ